MSTTMRAKCRYHHEWCTVKINSKTHSLSEHDYDMVFDECSICHEMQLTKL